MRVDQAVARLERKAAELREEGHYAAAHDWQRDASDLRRLWDKAANVSLRGRRK